MNKKVSWLCALCILLLIGSVYAGYVYDNLPTLSFVENPVRLQLHTTSYDPLQFIKEVEDGNLEDIIIKENHVDLEQLGSYEIVYQIGEKQQTLCVQIIDSLAPVVQVKDVSIEVEEELTPEQCIEDISDDTTCTSRFAQSYEFDQVGDTTIEVVVEDEGGNITTQPLVVHVLEKDLIPPDIKAQDVTLRVGDQFLASDYAKANDERDGEVEVEVTSNTVDSSKAGTYSVVYQASDRHHNTSTKEIKVTVLAKTEVPTGKVIYLTIDDGPSANTPAILDILDQYHVKATFFVSAQCPQYFNYIKVAYQKGHAIGLHTYSHSYASVYASDAAYFQDLQSISDVVFQQTNTRPTIIRFPGGSSNGISRSYNTGIMSRLSTAVQQKGYQYFDWNASSGDGNSATPSANLVANAKKYGGQTPLMMLTHDHAGSKTSVEALPEIIAYYQSLGYQFLTVNDSTNGFHHGIIN